MPKLPPLNLELDPVYRPYGRKSHPNEKRDQKHTEREQREGCLEWIKERIRQERRGRLADVPWLFDDDTGQNAQRPQYQRALAECRALRHQGRKVYLVVRLLDRLGRDAEELHRCYKELVALDVELVAVDMNGPISAEVFPYLVATAHVGSLKIAANVRRINAQVRRDGWWRPGRVPWGYVTVPTTEDEQRAGAPKVRLEIDPAAGGRVLEAFARVAKGEPVNRVARWIASLPAAERGCHQSKDGPRVRTLARQGLRVLLQNRVYIAQQPDGQLGNWPAIVPVPTWEAAQQATIDAKQMQPRQASGNYLLTGRLWCPICAGQGAAMRMRGWARGDKGTSPRYVCHATEVGARAPSQCSYSVRATDADRDVRRQVGPLLRAAATDRQTRRDVERAVRELLAEGRTPMSDVQSRIAAVDVEIKRVEDQQDELGRKLIRKQMRDREYTRLMAPLRDEEDRLRAQRDELAPALARDDGQADKLSVADVMRRLDAFAAAWEHEDQPAEQRPVLAELVERIAPIRGATRGTVRCEITWTELGHTLLALAEALGFVACPADEGAPQSSGEAAAG